MNKQEYLRQIIDEGHFILQQAQQYDYRTTNILTGRQVILLDQFSYEKWMTKTNDFLNKYNINNCKVQINGQMTPSDIMISKLAKITALYESLVLDDNCLSSLHLLPQDIKDLYRDKHYSQAVFDAFKYIEVKVRTKSGLDELLGVDLMRQAFSAKNGPLKNSKLPEGEQVAQMELYAGAIGFIKNPKSHKMLTLSEEKCIELLHLANYLLRVLEEN